jgi:hypothetical protein
VGSVKLLGSRVGNVGGTLVGKMMNKRKEPVYMMLVDDIGRGMVQVLGRSFVEVVTSTKSVVVLDFDLKWIDGEKDASRND